MNSKYIEYDFLGNNVITLTTIKENGNMAFQAENGEGVLNRREILSKDLNIDYQRFVFVHQYHSDKILEVKESDLGKGTKAFEDGCDCDALYTRLKNVPLGVFHADCVPIFFIANNEIVGIIHSGFIGTLKETTYKSIYHIINNEKIDASTIKVFIGPCRGKETLIIKDEEAKTIESLGYQNCLEYRNDGIHFDMRKMNVEMLKKLNIKSINIGYINADTSIDSKYFSAYRKEAGRMLSLIVLK